MAHTKILKNNKKKVCNKLTAILKVRILKFIRELCTQSIQTTTFVYFLNVTTIHDKEYNAIRDLKFFGFFEHEIEIFFCEMCEINTLYAAILCKMNLKRFQI